MNIIGGWDKRLPRDWSLQPLKSLADYLVSNVNKIPDEDELPVRLCNYTDVYNNDRITPDLPLMKATATEGEIERFGLKVGDVVITKDSESWDDIAVPAYVAETADDLVCGYHLAILRAKPLSLEGRFLFRCLQARPIRLFLELASTGVTRFGLPKGEIGSLPIPKPSLETQRRIANYLDRETGTIDALVTEKERMLELLNEKRTALISRVVIRGLDSRAPTKPSGIPWLGDIPKHWDVERSKRILKERNDRSTTGEEEMLTVSHLTGVTKRAEKEVNMFEAESNEGYKLASPDNLVINTLWAWMGAMGVSRDEGIASPAYHVYVLSPRLHPPFVDLLVRTSPFVKEITRFSKGIWSSRLRLYPEGLFEVYLPVPPLPEQRAIVAAIRREDERTAEIRSALADSIKLLRERRSALITAAVTGQMSTEEMIA